MNHVKESIQVFAPSNRELKIKTSHLNESHITQHSIRSTTEGIRPIPEKLGPNQQVSSNPQRTPDLRGQSRVPSPILFSNAQSGIGCQENVADEPRRKNRETEAREAAAEPWVIAAKIIHPFSSFPPAVKVASSAPSASCIKSSVGAREIADSRGAALTQRGKIFAGNLVFCLRELNFRRIVVYRAFGPGYRVDFLIFRGRYTCEVRRGFVYQWGIFVRLVILDFIEGEEAIGWLYKACGWAFVGWEETKIYVKNSYGFYN